MQLLSFLQLLASPSLSTPLSSEVGWGGFDGAALPDCSALTSHVSLPGHSLPPFYLSVSLCRPVFMYVCV